MDAGDGTEAEGLEGEGRCRGGDWLGMGAVPVDAVDLTALSLMYRDLRVMVSSCWRLNSRSDVASIEELRDLVSVATRSP